MYTPVEFVVELFANSIELFVIFITEVVMGVDPLTAVVWLTGAFITSASVAFLGYLALGALVREFGVNLPTPGRTRPPRL